MLTGLPLLKELDCENNPHLTGSLNSLRVLKDTLKEVDIFDCRCVKGIFMDLADFPHLRLMDFRLTNVTGDIRDIREHDFPALKSLSLPESLHGGVDYEFELISDMPSFFQEIHHFLQFAVQTPLPLPLYS
jgi:hypothetical protein